MPEASDRKTQRTAGTLLDELSREFGQIAERISDRWNDVPVRELSRDRAAVVEAAERAIDQTAADLVEGICGLSEWGEALSEYERAWAQVFDSLGERHN